MALGIASWLKAVFFRPGNWRRRRVPVMLQMNVVECGAACLAMILNYHGRRVRVAECREVCGVGRDGVTAKTIAAGARSFGLRVRAYSVAIADFKDIQLPAIIHWNFDHFMVVERWSPSQVDVVDPAVGRRRLTGKEFDEGFTGIVLVLEPGDQFEPRGAGARSLWRLYVQGIWRVPGTPGVLLQILAASLILQILGLAVPVFTQVLVDQVLPYRMTNILAMLGMGIGVVVAALAVLSYLRAGLLLFLQGRLDSQLMLGFFEHVLALPYRFFQQRTSGDLLMRLGSNAVIRATLTSQSLSMFLDGFLVLGYLTILLVRAPLFGLLVLGVGAVQVGVLLSTRRLAYALTQRHLAAEAESQSYLVEALTGIATLKATGGEDRVLDHWSNLFFKELNLSLRRSHLEAVIETALGALHVFAPLFLLWIGAHQVLNGTLSLGTMLALNALAMAFLTPLTSVAANVQSLQLVGAYLERIGDVVEAEPEQDPHQVQNAPPLQGRIDLKNVSFRYDPNGSWVLKDIFLHIEPGQKVALVGRSGSGKSTLAKLLLGLYPPTDGEILYDQLPLQGLNFRSVRRQFGVVMQESFLFSGTIRQNIAFNDTGLDLPEVMEAARLAVIHDEIVEMPMAYETLVAEGGTGLSGGQRQRLSIARALAHKPAVLLLDEATSHLDVLTERLVDENLSALAPTRIVIAHRLSTIRNADLILVLDNGVIVERGSHDELVEQKGVYESLVRS